MASIRIKLFEEALKRYESGNPEFTAREMADLLGYKLCSINGKLWQICKMGHFKKIGEGYNTKYRVNSETKRLDSIKYILNKYREIEFNERKQMIEGSEAI